MSKMSPIIFKTEDLGLCLHLRPSRDLVLVFGCRAHNLCFCGPLVKAPAWPLLGYIPCDRLMGILEEGIVLSIHEST